jgi:hypothetical protein
LSSEANAFVVDVPERADALAASVRGGIAAAIGEEAADGAGVAMAGGRAKSGPTLETSKSGC